jgi:hypothetical protein
MVKLQSINPHTQKNRFFLLVLCVCVCVVWVCVGEVEIFSQEMKTVTLQSATVHVISKYKRRRISNKYRKVGTLFALHNTIVLYLVVSK